MRNVTKDFKILTKKIKQQDLKLSIVDGELLVKDIHVMPVNVFNSIPINVLRARKEVIAKELIYSFEGELFKTIMQQIDITVKNANEIKGKVVNPKYGILINDSFEYVDLGEYYIKDINDDKNKEEITVTGYDKMLNFMKPFKREDLQLTYPCKMNKLVSRMGEICGVELYSTDFYNSELIVDEDFFTVQQLTYRDVLEKIAQATLTTIFIKENKLFLCRIGESVETLDTSYLSNLVISEKFGPVNALVLGRGSVEDNIEWVNQESIDKNGRCEIRFDENEFVDSKREELIKDMLQQIDGLEYYAFEASDVGVMWLEPCDVITVKDRENNPYSSIYLKAKITISTGIKTANMSADIPETATTEYKVTPEQEKKTLKVERLAKKNAGLIQDIIEEQTETSQKLTQHEQTIDEIKDTVSSIQEVTNIIEGNKTIKLENCVEGNILELHIFGNNTVFEHLYPSDVLYPSNGLFPYGDSRIEVTNKNNEATTYELGITDVLRQNGAIQDEYILKDGKAQIIRRINKDGTVKSKEEIEDLGEYSIFVNNGTNTIAIKNYTARMSAKFAIQNDYTDIFATRVEMSSSIRQTAEEIRMEVRRKANEEDVCSIISQSAEQILLKGNRVVIESNNFQLDEQGNIKCSNANISGTIRTYLGDKLALELNETSLKFFGCWSDGRLLGTLGCTEIISTSEQGISFYCEEGDYITIGYKEGNYIYSILEFDLDKKSETPYIANTASGTLLGGITVENGLIKNWKMNGVSGTLYLKDSDGVSDVVLTVENGLITGWEVA